LEYNDTLYEQIIELCDKEVMHDMDEWFDIHKMVLYMVYSDMQIHIHCMEMEV
jgi:hypothetical protein